MKIILAKIIQLTSINSPNPSSQCCIADLHVSLMSSPLASQLVHNQRSIPNHSEEIRIVPVACKEGTAITGLSSLVFMQSKTIRLFHKQARIFQEHQAFQECAGLTFLFRLQLTGVHDCLFQFLKEHLKTFQQEQA